ncbi:MAG TPA: extensin family protein [Polyangiaceae bacterium]|nr:extensin family protein [Polyangiaceae bacterium]
MNGPLFSLLPLAALALGLGGCAREAPEASSPYSASAGWVVPAGYAWPPAAVSHDSPKKISTREPNRTPSLPAQPLEPATSAPSSVFAKTLGDVPRPRTRNELRSVLPGSSDCLTRLSGHGVRFHALDRQLGVHTPIVVDGPIAGVRYYTGGNGPLIADCRLILALALVGGALTADGVSDIRFSGAYVYRLSAKRRVSLHAYGLAIDLHGFTRLGVHYEVKRDFRKGLGTTLESSASVSNAIAARFHNSGLFHEYLTPDDNADHHDHVHVGVSPLPDEVD